MLRAVEEKILREIQFGFVGRYPVAGMGEAATARAGETLRLLYRLGVGATLTLTEDDPFGALHQETGLVHLHLPLDDAEPAGIADLGRGVAFMEENIRAGRRVAVQCLEGRGRTGMVLAAWLAAHEGWDGGRAIEELRRLRPWTAFAPGQKESVKEFVLAR